MALASDLLKQAEFLAARKEPKRPQQASLRRAVSTAYYAVFHMLIADAGSLLPNKPPLLRSTLARAFDHRDMKEVCQQFAKGKVESLKKATQGLVQDPIELELVRVASAFVELQQARHGADYDTAVTFRRIEVGEKVRLAERAFADWGHVRRLPNGTAFLAALLLQRRWERSA